MKRAHHDSNRCIGPSSPRLRKSSSGRGGTSRRASDNNSWDPATQSASTTGSTSSRTDNFTPTSDKLHRRVAAASPSVANRLIQSGCSVKAVYDIVSKFDDGKKKLVESIGFGGLLRFPAIKTINRKFSAWLMQRVDVRNSSLALPDGSTLTFLSEDIAMVFGIPAGGMKVNEARQLTRQEKDKVKLQCWPQTGKKQQSIKSLEKLIDTKYNDAMTPDQADAFKVAFVVFVMSTLFVPGAKHDYAHVDYWGALANPNDIRDFDWASYIRRRLLMSAGKYRTDIETGGRTPVITGCDLFLQVFYLDNMDIPKWTMEQNVFPRISCFTYERIRSMIAADTHDRHATTSTCSYGKSKVRPRPQSCYAWARRPLILPGDADLEADVSLWRAVVTLITLLKVPLEAAGPLYVAAASLDRGNQPCNPRRTAEIITILIKIVEPFMHGFTYNFNLQPTDEDTGDMNTNFEIPESLLRYCDRTEYTCGKCSCNCKKRTYGINSTATASISHPVGYNPSIGNGEPSESSQSIAASSHVAQQIVAETIHQTAASIEYSVIKLMTRFYMLVQSIRHRNRLDLNTEAMEADGGPTIIHSEDQHVPTNPRSPWELGEFWDYRASATRPLPAAINDQVQSTHLPIPTMPRIIDYHPKYVEVMPDAAQDQRLGKLEMEMDMFDAIIRCYHESDNKLYDKEDRLRWRHYFESDILAAVIAGLFDIDNPCMRNQFIGAHLKYDIYNCNMLFFPVILHERWVCFSWDLVKNKVIVFDPTCINIPGVSKRSIYNRVAEVLKSTLSSIIPVLFPNWDHDWSAASVSPFHWRYGGMPCSNRTGVLCAYFCRCFDGHQLVPDMEQGELGLIAEKMFSEVSAHHKGRHRTTQTAL